MSAPPSPGRPADIDEAIILLRRALEILDRHKEAADAAIDVCQAIETLEGAPSVLEQWYLMTGRNFDGTDPS